MSIKNFFEQKNVKIVEGVIIFVAALGLLYGGVTSEGLAKIPTLAVSALTGLEGLITLIQGATTKA